MERRVSFVISDSPVYLTVFFCSAIIAASEDGKIYLLNDDSPVIETGNDHISNMRQCAQKRNLVAVGGKDRQNNLKIFDLEAQKQIFSSKNVPHDNLQLEVPVWDSDTSFVNNSWDCIATCSRYGYIRLYDHRQQRRPVQNYVDKAEQAFNSMTERNGTIFVSTTTGGLYAFDLKNMKVPLHTYKGAVGSITSIAVDETGKYIFSASLDRYVRVHNVDRTNLLYQCYVKSKATRILMQSANDQLLKTPQPSQDEKVAVSDCEYDELFEGMQTVEEEAGPVAKKKAKIEEKLVMKRHSGLTAPRKKAD